MARTGRFRDAAAELNVTRPAISHQIRALEEAVGVTLFERGSRPARLTDAGRSYFPVVRDAFDTLERATRTLAPADRPDQLVIQVYLTAALKWLIARLYDFEQRHPDLHVRLSTSYVDWDFDRDHADVGFILSRSQVPGLHYRPLFRSILSPVCNPALLSGKSALASPADLTRHTILQVDGAEEDWRLWLDAAGVDGVELADRVSFDTYILAQQAAEDGRGVAMTIGPFARDELSTGRLVEPFDLKVPHWHLWQLVCTEEARHEPKIRLFEEWLADQVRRDTEIEALS